MPKLLWRPISRLALREKAFETVRLLPELLLTEKLTLWFKLGEPPQLLVDGSPTLLPLDSLFILNAEGLTVPGTMRLEDLFLLQSGSGEVAPPPAI